MNIYNELAEALLDMDDYTFFKSGLNGEFGFEYRRDYSGLMAQPPKTGRNKGVVARSKQGLFDIVVATGSRFASVTHRDIFTDLMKNSDIDSCLEVWRGEDPRKIGKSLNEKEALTTLALLMFEQEVNWGNNQWQRSTNFPPLVRDPNRRRPRDMIMGYVSQAFRFGPDHLDKMKYWMKIRPGSIWFTDGEESPYGYSSYPDKYKRFFTELEHMDGTSAVMVGEMRKRFKDLSDKKPNNPWYDG